MIIRGGENIYPREIEAVLYEHPAVADVAVVGVPDDRWGEEVAAFVRLARGRGGDARPSSPRTSREQLAAYKAPRTWIFVDAFPLTGSGKIQKFVLRDQFVKGDLTPGAPTRLDESEVTHADRTRARRRRRRRPRVSRRRARRAHRRDRLGRARRRGHRRHVGRVARGRVPARRPLGSRPRGARDRRRRCRTRAAGSVDRADAATPAPRRRFPARPPRRRGVPAMSAPGALVRAAFPAVERAPGRGRRGRAARRAASRPRSSRRACARSSTDWPDRPLWINAVDLDTSRRVTFGRDGVAGHRRRDARSRRRARSRRSSRRCRSTAFATSTAACTPRPTPISSPGSASTSW